MTEYPYILFNKSPEQMRHLGARGGRAYGRNQRARRALVATSPEAVPPPVVPRPNGRRSHPRSGHPVSVAARCGKVTSVATRTPERYRVKVAL